MPIFITDRHCVATVNNISCIILVLRTLVVYILFMRVFRVRLTVTVECKLKLVFFIIH